MQLESSHIHLYIQGCLTAKPLWSGLDIFLQPLPLVLVNILLEWPTKSLTSHWHTSLWCSLFKNCNTHTNNSSKQLELVSCITAKINLPFSTSLENDHHFLEILSGFHVVHGTLNLLAFCQLCHWKEKKLLQNCSKISVNADLIGFASQITFFVPALLQWLEKSLSFSSIYCLFLLTAFLVKSEEVFTDRLKPGWVFFKQKCFIYQRLISMDGWMDGWTYFYLQHHLITTFYALIIPSNYIATSEDFTLLKVCPALGLCSHYCLTQDAHFPSFPQGWLLIFYISLSATYLKSLFLECYLGWPILHSF